MSHLLAACVDEFSENEDLPNTTNPDDWARISGKKGERIVYIRTLVSGKTGTEAGRSIDTVANTGSTCNAMVTSSQVVNALPGGHRRPGPRPGGTSRRRTRSGGRPRVRSHSRGGGLFPADRRGPGPGQRHPHQQRPVIVFFDEMDSIFRTRGPGVSSDVEDTIVPQLLSRSTRSSRRTRRRSSYSRSSSPRRNASSDHRRVLLYDPPAGLREDAGHGKLIKVSTPVQGKPGPVICGYLAAPTDNS